MVADTVSNDPMYFNSALASQGAPIPAEEFKDLTNLCSLTADPVL